MQPLRRVASVRPGVGHYGVYGRWEEFLGALIRHPQAATET